MYTRQHNSHHQQQQNYRWQMFILFLFLLMFISYNASAQARSKKKLDLEDLSIKGELLNDGRLNILGRERVALENYVKFRTNYRQVMVQGLPTPAPKRVSDR
jgi:hypothetical protein